MVGCKKVKEGAGCSRDLSLCTREICSVGGKGEGLVEVLK